MTEIERRLREIAEKSLALCPVVPLETWRDILNGALHEAFRLGWEARNEGVPHLSYSTHRETGRGLVYDIFTEDSRAHRLGGPHTKCASLGGHCAPFPVQPAEKEGGSDAD